MASIEIEFGVKRRVSLLPWGRVAGRPAMTLEAQFLWLYSRCLCCFPPAPVLPLGGRMSLWVVVLRVSSVLDWALIL